MVRQGRLAVARLARSKLAEASARRGQTKKRDKMYFAVSCYDKEDSLDLRMATREKHLAFATNAGARIIVGGALLSADDKMIGSHLIVEAD